MLVPLIICIVIAVIALAVTTIPWWRTTDKSDGRARPPANR